MHMFASCGKCGGGYTDAMRIVIIGAGAVGGYFAGALAQAGADVAVVARGETLRVIQQSGVTLIDVPGDTRRIPVPAFRHLADVGSCDVILVATKALDGTNAFESLAGVPEDAIVVPLQNSVEAPEIAAKIVGDRRRVWPGVVRGFLHHAGPGVVEFHGGPLSLTFGSWSGEKDDRLAELASWLDAAGIAAHVHSNIWLDVWSKAMFVSSLSALGALTAEPLGTLLADEVLAREFRSFVEEIALVAQAGGVEMPNDIVDRTMEFAAAMPPESTSSLQRDLLAGNHAELDAQIGAISRLADQRGVVAPRFALSYAVLRHRL